jgi:hypothetical protein
MSFISRSTLLGTPENDLLYSFQSFIFMKKILDKFGNNILIFSEALKD